MKNTTIIAFAALIVSIGIFTLLIQLPNLAGASVPTGEQYQSTTTPILVDLVNLCPARVGYASSTTGVFGSIVYTGPNIGSLHIYDATTSNASLRAASLSTSSILLGEIPALVAGNATTSPQTFTFDVDFKYGLLVDEGGSAPTTTITYRCEY